ncbi:MAG: putative DNA binding domain-containing protein [Tannerella sp.]|jgi:ATP-dependent DNA helicase RecG|nr:putative DNA binding domain-containing protein [Tannerella sp.]
MLSNQTYQIPEKESETIEFKVSFNVETIETLVAFANAGGGSIHIGIADTRAIIGVSVGKETVPQWINEIKSKTEPALIPDVNVAEVEGKQIVVLSITEFPIKPVSIKGRYYKRTGHSNQLLTLNEILNMHLKTFNSSWDYYFDPNHSVLDISEEKTLNLIALYNRERVIPIEKNVFEFLSKMELVREGKVTHAAFLLLMKNDSILSDIELGHFQNEITIKDGITISTDLISEVEEVLTFVRKHISKEFIITANPARIERWDYPLEALREIVLNMIVHRNYAHHGNSSVKIFPDRIEFFNPGRLPDNITVNDLLQGTYTSDCRNKLIAKIFKEIDWIERYGTGIRRIRDYFREYGSPEPVFENFQHGFRVIVYPLRREFDNNVIDVIDNVPDVPDNVPDNVPDVPDNVPDVIDNVPDVPDNFIENRHTAIINLIKSDAEISIPNLSKSLKVSHKTIQRDIKILKNKGLIERIGNDRGGYWKINENLPLE